MPIENLKPTVLESSNNLIGSVTSIDDDPDNPDSSWLLSVFDNMDTDCRVSFGTPASTPLVGSGLQQFKAVVRRSDDGLTGVPDVRLELWEDGVLVRAGTDESVDSQQHVVTLTWNANELSDSTGAGVECKVVGTFGGSGGQETTVEPGAVEWNGVTGTAIDVQEGTAQEVFQDHAALRVQGGTTDPFVFPGMFLGEPETTRQVLVFVSHSSNPSTAQLTSLSIGATSATFIAGTTVNSLNHDVFLASIPTGTSETITAVIPGSRTHVGISVYSVYGAETTVFDTDTDDQDPANLNVGVNAGGLIIAGGSANSNTTYTWTELTEDIDFEIATGSNSSLSTASKAYASDDASVDIEVDSDGTGTRLVAAIAVVFDPNPIPAGGGPLPSATNMPNKYRNRYTGRFRYHR